MCFLLGQFLEGRKSGVNLALEVEILTGETVRALVPPHRVQLISIDHCLFYGEGHSLYGRS